MLNFPESTLLNIPEWELKPLQFNVRLLNKSNLNPDEIFGFYGSDFQPFNTVPFLGNQ